MFKSAMGEQRHAESEDFILVQQPDEMRDDLSDDDSYDYCEDVFSEHSMGQTMSICSEATETLILKDIVLTVPSILLKDLDEAHAAAELAQIPDLEQSEASVASSSENNNTEMDLDPEKDPKPATSPKPPATRTNPPAVTMSRASNKKRRKQLKLTKKTLAATNATNALSGKTRAEMTAISMFPPKKAPKTKSKSSSTGRPSKKVANIAVTCATETLATYREELLCKQQFA
jgi:hypothetical protein